MDDIKKLANRLARQHHSRDPFDIIKALNVILVFAHLEGVRGFYQYFKRNHIIYIDEGLPELENRLVCAHEMGHMLLHRKVNTVFMDTRTFISHSKFENEANKFAAELLIPDEVLTENKDFTIEQLSRLLGYHERLINLRLQ